MTEQILVINVLTWMLLDWRKHKHSDDNDDDNDDASAALFVLVITLSWLGTLLFNIIVLSAGFVRCHMNGMQVGSLEFCHVFGNPEVAKRHGWKGGVMDMLLSQTVLAGLLLIICWQL